MTNPRTCPVCLTVCDESLNSCSTCGASLAQGIPKPLSQRSAAEQQAISDLRKAEIGTKSLAVIGGCGVVLTLIMTFAPGPGEAIDSRASVLVLSSIVVAAFLYSRKSRPGAAQGELVLRTLSVLGVLVAIGLFLFLGLILLILVLCRGRVV